MSSLTTSTSSGQGAPVPKRMNQLGMGGSPVEGSLLTPDPVDQTRALGLARAAEHATEAALHGDDQRGDDQHGGERPAGERREILAGRPAAGRPRDIQD